MLLIMKGKLVGTVGIENNSDWKNTSDERFAAKPRSAVTAGLANRFCTLASHHPASVAQELSVPIPSSLRSTKSLYDRPEWRPCLRFQSAATSLSISSQVL
jgi:hypothetical protein